MAKPTPDVRGKALRATAAQLRLSPSEALPRVWSAILEEGFPKGVYGLVSFAEGTTSIYIGYSEPILGTGRYASVRRAADAWLRCAESLADRVPAGSPEAVPGLGEVRVTLRTYSGDRSILLSVADLRAGRHPLAPLYAAAQDVIEAIRVMTER